MAYYSIYYKHDKVMETLADNKPILSNRRALLSLIASLLMRKIDILYTVHVYYKIFSSLKFTTFCFVFRC